MSFHTIARDISLDGTVLRANVPNDEGELIETALDLNDAIGNDNGDFQWGGGAFSESAEEISFSFESDDNIPVLRAQLRNIEGELIDANLNLAERISARGGQLIFE